ncbi:MAG: excinuclease ABC subunit UvrA [Proteobacteria bacterium]|nr:excinuclease ABC subunit UvrA [Pseudomonadota bacterium]
MSEQGIVVRGARMHNLKNIDVTIPRNKLVVVTGLSGSGKSSLAFDTIYAEGQRRYIESLSAYARQFLGQMDKPDVDSIEGLSPAISIEQRTASKNPRSTVGTATEIYDYLRLLYARAGTPHCVKCGRPIEGQTVQQMVDRLTELPEGARIVLFAPIASGRKGEYAKELAKLARDGFVRARIDGEVHELADPPKLDKKKKHDIDLMVDRLVIKPSSRQRLADSLEIALKHGDGIVKVETGTGDRGSGTGKGLSGHGSRVTGHEILLSEKHACPHCGISLPEIQPQLFSFNSPRGACADCDGLGVRRYFDPDLIVPNRQLSLREGAIMPWRKKNATDYIELVEALSKHYRADIYTPFAELPERLRETILHGSGDEQIAFTYDTGRGRKRYTAKFEGIIPSLQRRWEETQSFAVREEIERYMNMRPCPTCGGTRLKAESLAVLVGEKNISELCALSIDQALRFVKGLRLDAKRSEIAKGVLKEITERLGFLTEVGLGYLTLDRASATLAGGEDQRIRLATQIGSALTGVLYVLDEPSIGLHQRDNHRLINTLKRLRDLRNTVLVVEHDRDMMLASDHIIDLGPGAGVAGGRVVATGTPDEVSLNGDSLTGLYLAGKRAIEKPRSRRRPSVDWIEIIGASEHNLKSIDVRIPLGLMTAVTGVSGSGKSTLVTETLLAALRQRIYRSRDAAGQVEEIRGWERIAKVIDIDQSPIGRTPRSNPATYTGIFTHIRDLFSELPESKARGYRPGRFSFNVKGGRCEACEGDGIIRIEMHFLPDVFVECEVCRGMRFNRETLEVTYKGKNISEVLKMTVAEAHRFFENIPPLAHKLETLVEVGLEYIELGQAATTLSGGEAQRIKLSRELSRRPRMTDEGMRGKTLYILDEPTTGLHFDDVHKLLGVLEALVEAGNTVIVIEHNLDVIKFADYCVDLGPEGGDAGGEVVAVGTPEEIAANPKSHTGRYLKEVL